MEYFRRVFRRIPPLNELHQRSSLSYEQYIAQNRKNVLQLYRTFLKTLPPLFPRLIERRAKIEECKFLFREGRSEQFEQNIKHNMQIGYHVLQQIKLKKYPPFPQLYSSVSQEDPEEYTYFNEINPEHINL